MNTLIHRFTALGLASLALVAGLVWAAPPTVEIIAMTHPPVNSALMPLRDWLTNQEGKVRVVELDAESPQGIQRLESLGLRGHIPIVILIDGEPRYRRKEGNTVAFVNFPAVKESPARARGDWQIADVQEALKERMSTAR